MITAIISSISEKPDDEEFLTLSFTISPLFVSRHHANRHRLSEEEIPFAATLQG